MSNQPSSQTNQPAELSHNRSLKRGMIVVLALIGAVLGFFLIDGFAGTPRRIISIIEAEPLFVVMPIFGLIVGLLVGFCAAYPRQYIEKANKFSATLGYWVSWLTSFLVFFVFLNVVIRYGNSFLLLRKETLTNETLLSMVTWLQQNLFEGPAQYTLAVQETQWHIFGMIFMFGAGYTLMENRHVRVDIFYANLSPKAKATIDLLGSVIFLFSFCLITMYYSYEFVIRSFEMGEVSPNPGGLPGRYLIKAIIPIGLFFLLIQGLAMTATAALTIIEDVSSLFGRVTRLLMPFVAAFALVGGLYYIFATEAVPKGPSAMLFFGALLIFLMIGFPVAFTLVGASIIFGAVSGNIDFFGLFPNRAFGTIENLILMAVPLFVYMGVTLERSGLAEELLETMALLFGRLRGGLAISVVFVGALLAASTGIVGATVVTMGLLSLPTMIKRGYSVELATGTIAASGTLGQIIPPSIVLVLLGSVLNVPVGDMFIGGFMPGLMIVGLYMIWILFISFMRPKQAPAMPAEELAEFTGFTAIRRTFVAFIPPVFLIVAVLGTILAGIATPTEAAGVGCVGALLLITLKGRLTLDAMHRVMKETTLLTCMVFLIIIGATGFALIFKALDGPNFFKEFVLSFELSPMVFLAFVMVVIFIAGFFIDFIEITYIIVPVVYPIFLAKGVDILWLGILIAVNLQTSFITPPFGFALFYLKGVAPPEVTTGQIYRGAVAFIGIQVIAITLLVMFPGISTCLPAYFSWSPENARQTTALVGECGPTVASWFGAVLPE